MEVLRECPFCGGENIAESGRFEADDPYAFGCATCWALGPSEETYAEAIATWNTRSSPEVVTVTEEMIEALKPFAEAARIKLCGNWNDEEHFGQTDVNFALTFGDLRRAHAALSKLSPLVGFE